MPRVVPTQGMAYLLGRLPLPSAAAWRAAAAASHAAPLPDERDQRFTPQLHAPAVHLAAPLASPRTGGCNRIHLSCVSCASQVINAENYALRALRDLGYTHARNGCEAVAPAPAPAESSASPSRSPSASPSLGLALTLALAVILALAVALALALAVALALALSSIPTPTHARSLASPVTLP